MKDIKLSEFSQAVTIKIQTTKKNQPQSILVVAQTLAYFHLKDIFLLP